MLAFVRGVDGPALHSDANQCRTTSRTRSTLEMVEAAHFGEPSAPASVASSGSSLPGDDHHPCASASARKVPSQSHPISPLRTISRTVSPARLRTSARQC
ncbi:MAG: hypothetical protein GJU76_04220 [Gallionella sp.]|jgi:hypothetical protein|nr:hypothetical protein [Gallionella sp.]